MDTSRGGILCRFDRSVDVRFDCASEAANLNALQLSGNLLHRLEIAWARDREARLNSIDPHQRKLSRDANLLLWVQGRAWRLLPIS
ncbi:hypothetical protein D3C86_1871320 [compost metagenome]